MILIGKKLCFDILGGKRFLKLFGVLFLQIFRDKSNIVGEISRNVKMSANGLIGLWMQKYR